ncbi:leucine-rich repeat domain-containing protein [Maribacter hydrothermalis]|uniref:Ig-like domain-containing protein n=1 Tax=Maribacter hydrothermalis TaxID=1836467 RepID=A0A1B7ZFG2_9FLAO|nr:T9SS type A sorting domain-containing protein [Maribacter hydrothermalis]APQ17814.1 hypothetical protein BTR34_10965 [Maribacter hydrothermalis]OBR42288.1 hypothetical protein A9200_02580 [Maribacter hydrothermalis]
MLKNYTKLLFVATILFSLNGFSQANYLTNFSFENWSGNPETPDNWSITNANDIIKSSDATDGNFALGLGLNNTLANQTTLSTWNTSVISLTSNANHTFSFDYKISTETGNNLSAYLDIVKDEGSYTIQYIHEFIPLESDGAWHTYTFDFDTDTEEDYAFELIFRANTNPASSIIVDNLQVLDDDATTNPDRDALIALYNATDGDNWTVSWDFNADISTWPGLTLNTEGRVRTLVLDSRNLTGEIPAEIGNLTELEWIDLGRNNLTGEIPAQFGNLLKLERLNLRTNQLTGNVPSELGKLSNLEVLLLNSNNLTGALPIELGNLSAIQQLDFTLNQLSGPIPVFLGNLTSLTYLSLYGNQLTGTIPQELSNLTNLKSLVLGNNDLTGEIPSQIYNLTELLELNIFSTNISGTIPPEIGNLTKLVFLRLGDTQMSGSIPSEIGNLTQLEDLALFRSNFFGPLPQEIGNLTKLEKLRLDNNNFTGSLPSSIGNLILLKEIGLRDNNLSGNLPSEIGNLTSLENFYLSNNQISGSLPASIGNLSSIKSIWFGSNNFSGSIPPEIGNLTQLELLILNTNELTGTIPSEMGNMSNLSTADFGNNTITGGIPTEIGNLAQLRAFGCENCSLSGNVPVFSSSLSKNVVLKNNNLTFGDLDNSIINSVNTAFNIHPQRNLNNEEEIELDLGDEATIAVTGLSHSNNQFQWRKDGTNLIGETNSTLIINSTTVNDIGVYDCVIINPNVPSLTLYRNSFTIKINGIDGEGDDDNDGIKNSNDFCPNTSPGASVNQNGCTESQLDDDNDGVNNTNDICPNTPNGESVNRFGCSESQLSDIDDDNDGVPNDIDVCKNTPVGAVTGDTGCSYQDILVPKPDDVIAKAKSTSCPDTANGILTVEFKVNQTHIVSITGPNNFSSNYTQQNGSTLLVTDLEPGTYTIIVNSEIGLLVGAPSIEFTLNIETPEEFTSGKTVIDYTAKKASVVVSGSKNYEVLVNNNVYSFQFENDGNQQLSFPLDKGSNLISIETDKICQGVYNDNVMVNNAILSPNPVGEGLKVEGIEIMSNAQILITNLNGVTVLLENKQITNGTLEMNISNLSPGIYMLTIIDGEKEINLKFVKK